MNDNELPPENREAVYGEPVSPSAVQVTSDEVDNSRVEINRDASITEGDTFGDWDEEEEDDSYEDVAYEDLEEEDVEEEDEEEDEDTPYFTSPDMAERIKRAGIEYHLNRSAWANIVNDTSFFASQVTEDCANQILGDYDQTTDAKDHLTMMTLTKLDEDTIVGLLVRALSDMPYHKVVAMLHQSGFTLTPTPTEVREEYSKGSFYD